MLLQSVAAAQDSPSKLHPFDLSYETIIYPNVTEKILYRLLTPRDSTRPRHTDTGDAFKAAGEGEEKMSRSPSDDAEMDDDNEKSDDDDDDVDAGDDDNKYNGKLGKEKTYPLISFLELHEILTRWTKIPTATGGEAYGYLSWLYLFGIPAEANEDEGLRGGELAFPSGWPRDIDRAIEWAILGSRHGGCGLCHVITSFLLNINYPPLVNATTANISNSISFNSDKRHLQDSEGMHFYNGQLRSVRVSFNLDEVKAPSPISQPERSRALPKIKQEEGRMGDPPYPPELPVPSHSSTPRGVSASRSSRYRRSSPSITTKVDVSAVALSLAQATGHPLGMLMFGEAARTDTIQADLLAPQNTTHLMTRLHRWPKILRELRNPPKDRPEDVKTRAMMMKEREMRLHKSEELETQRNEDFGERRKRAKGKSRTRSGPQHGNESSSKPLRLPPRFSSLAQCNVALDAIAAVAHTSLHGYLDLADPQHIADPSYTTYKAWLARMRELAASPASSPSAPDSPFDESSTPSKNFVGRIQEWLKSLFSRLTPLWKGLGALGNSGASYGRQRLPPATHPDEGGRAELEVQSAEYAEFVRHLAAQGDPDGAAALGDLHYNGHYAGGIERDPLRAVELWGEAADQGHHGAAMAKAFIHIDGIVGNTTDAGPLLSSIAESPESSEIHQHLAKHYLHKYGLEGWDKNATLAGIHLHKAAEDGDVTAQLLMGHAYAGHHADVIPPPPEQKDGAAAEEFSSPASQESPTHGHPSNANMEEALRFYRLASEGGRTVGSHNVAVLTLRGHDKKYVTALQRCEAALPYFHEATMHHDDLKILFGHAERALQFGDLTGGLLRVMLLSELGHPLAHLSAASLWTWKANLETKEQRKMESVMTQMGEGIVLENESSFIQENDTSEKTASLSPEDEQERVSEFLRCWVDTQADILPNSPPLPSSANLPIATRSHLCASLYEHRAAAAGIAASQLHLAQAYRYGSSAVKKDSPFAYRLAREASWSDLSHRGGLFRAEMLENEDIAFQEYSRIEAEYRMVDGSDHRTAPEESKKLPTIAFEMYGDIMRRGDLASRIIACWHVVIATARYIQRRTIDPLLHPDMTQEMRTSGEESAASPAMTAMKAFPGIENILRTLHFGGSFLLLGGMLLLAIVLRSHLSLLRLRSDASACEEEESQCVSKDDLSGEANAQQKDVASVGGGGLGVHDDSRTLYDQDGHDKTRNGDDTGGKSEDSLDRCDESEGTSSDVARDKIGSAENSKERPFSASTVAADDAASSDARDQG